MPKHSLVLVLLLSYAYMTAQYKDTIRSPRPGQTIGAFSVGKGVLQFQQGVHFAKNGLDFFAIPVSGPSFTMQIKEESITTRNVIRFGIAEKIELNAVVDYRWDNNYYHSPGSSDPAIGNGTSQYEDFSALQVGVRYNILDGANPIGVAWGIQARAGFVNMIHNFSSMPDIIVQTAVDKRFGDKHGLRGNVGLVASTNVERFTYGLNYSFRPLSDLGISLEYTGISESGQPDLQPYTLQLGISYLLTNNLQLDAYGGYASGMGRWPGGKGYIIGGGLSWRLKLIKI